MKDCCVLRREILTSKIQGVEFMRCDLMWYDTMSCGVVRCEAMCGEVMWRVESTSI